MRNACDFCGVPLDEPTADASCPHTMTSGKLRDMARDERECAAELVTQHNEMRALGGKPGVHFDDAYPAQCLARAAELERAASLDEAA
jgi:hypothetical protein